MKHHRTEALMHISGPLYKIGFLYNHEAAHQVAHSAPVAAELARTGQARVTIIVTSQLLLERARQCIPPILLNRIEFVCLEAPPWQRAVASVVDAAAPFSRVANLLRHKEQLAAFDALVVTERTSLMLRTMLGERTPFLIQIPHGSGDRAIGFTRDLADFDLLLVSGEKLRRRMREMGLVRDGHCAVVGYPKFETLESAPPRDFFGNGKPTVLYNPHLEPALSSWYDMGLDVLDYFRASSEYNLIFAPHVMLFKRRIQISSGTGRVRLRRDIPDIYYNCPNILIDTGSSALVDMTYTRAADIYLGDISSQIYEFLVKPRPCVFLNAHDAAWRNDPNYACWSFGSVVSNVPEMDRALDAAVRQPGAYRLAQERGFRDTFDMDGAPSQRAAEAITGFMRRARRQVQVPATVMPSTRNVGASTP